MRFIVLALALTGCATIQPRSTAGTCFEVADPKAGVVQGKVISCNENSCKVHLQASTVLGPITINARVLKDKLDNDSSVTTIECQ